MTNLKSRLDQTYLESKKIHDVLEPNTKGSLIKRIIDNKKAETENFKKYDLENDFENIESFKW